MKKGNNEGSIRRRSNGTWEGRYSDGRDDNGRQIQRSVYGKTRKEVAEKLNAVLHNKQTGSYVTPSKTMLKEWLIQWLQNYASVAGLHKRYNHKQSDSRNSNSTSGKA